MGTSRPVVLGAFASATILLVGIALGLPAAPAAAAEGSEPEAPAGPAPSDQPPAQQPSADRPPAQPPPALRPGALEAGLSGALVSHTGSTQMDLGLRLAWLVPVGNGGKLLPVELGASWSHVRMVDTAGLYVSVQWTGALGGAPTVWPFVGAVAGVRQDWIGSFREVRYPTGGVLGLRLLASDRAAFRVEYRLLRVLGDPVEDFTEHRLLFGISLLFPLEDG